MIGLEPDVPNQRLRVRPRLLHTISRLELANVPVGSHRITISIDGDRVEVGGLDHQLLLELDRETSS